MGFRATLTWLTRYASATFGLSRYVGVDRALTSSEVNP
jgi:hypothetical protein